MIGKVLVGVGVAGAVGGAIFLLTRKASGATPASPAAAAKDAQQRALQAVRDKISFPGQQTAPSVALPPLPGPANPPLPFPPQQTQPSVVQTFPPVDDPFAPGAAPSDLEGAWTWY